MDGQQAAVPELVSKGQFAVLTNVSKGRVSQWIAEGKIDGDALDGEGRDAKVRVPIALAQLKKRLNIDQRFGNGLGTRLDLRLVSPAPTDEPVEPPPPRPPTVEEKIALERLEQLQRNNRQAAKEEATRAGLLTDAEDARRQFGRIAQSMVTVFEGALTDLATSISATFKLPQRDVLHHLRGEFRKVRAAAAESVRRASGELLELTEIEIGDREDDDA